MVNIEVSGENGRVVVKGVDAFEHVADLMVAAECGIRAAASILHTQKKEGVKKEAIEEDIEKLVACMLGHLTADNSIREDALFSIMIEAMVQRDRNNGKPQAEIERAVRFVKDTMRDLGDAIRETLNF